jgi:predicted RNA-binding protein with PIN domain
MPEATHIIIDGNNFIHRDPDLSGLARSDFETARHRLVAMLEGFSDADQRVTVIFDGKIAGPASQFTSTTVHVEFSPGHLSADTVIERMVMQSRNPDQITVVTSDRGVRDMVEASNGNSMSCVAFIELLQGSERQRRTSSAQKPAPGNKLGDMFPE